MSPKWGRRLVAFIPPLAFAVVPPLVLPSFPLVPSSQRGMVSHSLAPFRLSSALLLDLLVLLSLLDLSPTYYLILTYPLPYPPPIQGLSYIYGYLSSELPTAPNRV